MLHAATQRPGSHTDCFTATVPLHSAADDGLARFAFIFFDSWLFRLELKILGLAGKAYPTHSDPVALAKGETDHFAAWIVDGRTDTELLLRVAETPILTWLSVAPTDGAAHLFFGSGILSQDGKTQPHWGFRATMGAHKFYSVSLLRAAVADWKTGKALPR
ncbi:MAG: hypothetical protein AAF280_03995 [Pseudomonadota bacterium]